MVGDADEMFSIGRQCHRDAAVGTAAAVVVALDVFAVRAVHVEYAVQRRADRPRVYAYVDALAFFSVERKPVDVAVLVDNSVERQRQRCLGDGDDVPVFVGLLLKDVRERGDAEGVCRRRGETVRLGQDAEVGIRLGRGRDRLAGQFALGPDETNLGVGARLATGGEDRTWPRKLADVQSVPAVAAATVRAVAHLDPVIAVGRRDDRGETILQQQRRVVRGIEFKSFGIEDRDVRVEQRVAEPDRLDLRAQHLSFYSGDAVVIHILVLHRPLDSRIEWDCLRCGEVVVRFLLGGIGELVHPKCLQRADAGGGDKAQLVLAQRTVCGDGNRCAGFLRVFRYRLDFFHRKAGRVKQHLAHVTQPVADESHLHRRAALAAARQDEAKPRRCRLAKRSQSKAKRNGGQGFAAEEHCGEGFSQAARRAPCRRRRSRSADHRVPSTPCRPRCPSGDTPSS